MGINEGVRDGKWFTIYLPIWPLVLAAGEISGHPWLVNPVIGVLTTFVIYGFGRRLFGADAALLSAVLYAFSPFIIFNNASFFSEPLFLLLLLLFLWAYITARDGGSRGAAVAAGVLLPLAFGAREYSTFAAALPLLAVWAAEAARRKPAKIPFSFFALGAGLGAVPLLSYNVVTSGTILQFPRFYALKTHFGLSLPFVSGDMLFFTTRRLWVLATDFLGWPLLSLLPALLPLFIRKVPAPARTLYAVALSTFILFILPHHKGINYGARYYYGALPAALLVGGYGLTLLPGWLKEKWSLPAGSAAAAVILAFIVTTPAYIAAAAPIYKDYWGFPEGKKPWVTPQLEQALAAYGVWQGIVFIAPPSRCEGPAPNDVDLKNNLIFARDRGPRNAAFAALWLPRPHLLVDYREFEETGVIHALELNLPPKTREKK